jgi:hypothetical protein
VYKALIITIQESGAEPNLSKEQLLLLLLSGYEDPLGWIKTSKNIKLPAH